MTTGAAPRAWLRQVRAGTGPRPRHYVYLPPAQAPTASLDLVPADWTLWTGRYPVGEDDVRRLAADCVPVLRGHSSHTVLFGHGLGAAVVYDLAQLLTGQGCPPAGVLIAWPVADTPHGTALPEPTLLANLRLAHGYRNDHRHPLPVTMVAVGDRHGPAALLAHRFPRRDSGTGQHPAPPPDLVTRFRDVARTHPTRPAVWATDAALTFAELDTRTARLSSALRERGIGRGHRVGIHLSRGAGQLVALLAIWRAGAAYVPLDPAYPADRLAFMAADAGVTAMVGAGEPPAWATGTVLSPSACPTELDPVHESAPAADAPAYVIYTSGSTGRPKGVEVTRGSVASLVTAYEQVGVFAPEPRAVALNASISFDASVHWVRVCRGDTIVVLDERHRRDADTLRALFEEQGVTDLDLTPTHWEMLRADLLPQFADGRTLRLFVGGEAMSPEMWREIADSPGVEGFNLYGPTECTVDVTAAWIDGTAPHLGRPLPDSSVYLLDRTLLPVPNGDVGELFVGGRRLATGYVNRPGLTAARFLPDPFGAPGARMYRTGDRASRSDDGTLVFGGRVDRQVKLRGFRIELGEVEQHIAAHPDVARAVVELHGERLVAYVVPVAGRCPPDPAQLASYLAARVPAFLVPATFVSLDRLPMTGNDKVDVVALRGDS